MNMEVMTHVYDAYGMLMVGTYANLTNKKSRTGADFPFAQLTNGAMKFVEHGCSRVAFKEVKCSHGNKFIGVQATFGRTRSCLASCITTR